MDLDLSGKRALVCGSSQGIGKACAEALAALGAEVTLTSRNAAKLAAVRDRLAANHGQRHRVVVADFSVPDAVRRAIEQHVAETGAFEILVTNSGGPPPGTALAADVSEFVAAINSHLVTFQHLVQVLVPGMKERGYGRIVNVISTSVKQPIPGLGVSNTVRGAVAGWAKTLANELGPFGITVNNVLPGATETARLQESLGNAARREGKPVDQVAAERKARIPLRRFATPAETAAAVAFLAAPAAAYVTGINLPVDGGSTGCL